MKEIMDINIQLMAAIWEIFSLNIYGASQNQDPDVRKARTVDRVKDFVFWFGEK